MENRFISHARLRGVLAFQKVFATSGPIADWNLDTMFRSIDKFSSIDSALIMLGNFLLARSTFDFVVILWKMERVSFPRCIYV